METERKLRQINAARACRALEALAAELDAAASRIEGLPKRVRKQLPGELAPERLRAAAREARETGR